MSPLIQLKKTTPAILVAVACFGLSSMAQALLPPPPPDGGYLNQNTAEGDGALFSLTTGGFNTAIGSQALHNNTTGDFNTASGRSALHNNTTGDGNTASGSQALELNTTGGSNTATGVQALLFNTSGGSNTATGRAALHDNTGGSANTANGTEALYNNTTAFFNTAMGFQALYNNRTGLSNTANGYQALYLNTTGGSNTATGVQALYRTTGGGNIALGFQAGVNLTTGSDNIVIGALGAAGEASTIRIGKPGTQTRTFIAGIRGVTVPSGVGVIVGSNHQLGTVQSSKRFKEAIEPMDKTSEAILALKPVSFRYKHEFDPDRIPQFGLVAEDVEKVNPDLVVRDENGDLSSVRYEAVNAMLLNEFLKEHRKNEEQQATITDLKAEIATLAAMVKEQDAKIERVNDKVELSKPAPQTVLND